MSSQEATRASEKEEKNSFSIQTLTELRDPMTNVFSFLSNPSPLHRTCWFLLECYEHTHYLETRGQCCPHIVALPNKTKKCPRLMGRRIPVQLYQVKDIAVVVRPQILYSLHLVGLQDVTSFQDLKIGEGVKEIRIAQCPKLLDIFFKSPPVSMWIRPSAWTADSLVLEHLDQLQQVSSHITLNVTKLRMSHLPSLHTLDLHPSRRLQEVVLEDLPELSQVCDNFVRFTEIESFQLKGLPKLRLVGAHFMERCCECHEVSLQDLPHLTRLGAGTLDMQAHGTEAVLSRVTMANLPALTDIGDNFLRHSSNLKELSLSTLPQLQTVGSKWLAESGLREFKVGADQLPALTGVGSRWLAQSAWLRSVILDGLPKLTKIDDYFLEQCKQLSEFQLSNLPELAELGISCLSRSGVKRVKFFQLGKLHSIGVSLLGDCPKVSEFTFEDLPALTKLGAYALECCPLLQRVNMRKLPALQAVGDGFMALGKQPKKKVPTTPLLRCVFMTECPASLSGQVGGFNDVHQVLMSDDGDGQDQQRETPEEADGNERGKRNRNTEEEE